MVQESFAQELDIELPEELAEGEYANLVVIAHSTSEFVLDFVRMVPGRDKARVKSRVILSPEHAKRLLMTLQENITRYESILGRIPLYQMPTEETQIAMNFPGGEA